ncbi:MAG TPA: hypothetical protein VF765_16300 [Polyangiaceae bacterium]
MRTRTWPRLLVGTTCLAALGVACSSGSSPTGPQQPSCAGVVEPNTCPSPSPSWKSDVEPLIEKYCWQCHANGGIDQPMVDLSTYAGAKQNAVRILQQVHDCLMPNFGATPPPKAYPTADERNTIIAWAGVCMAPDN